MMVQQIQYHKNTLATVSPHKCITSFHAHKQICVVLKVPVVPQRFFDHTVSNTKGEPTNYGFIALIADKLQLQLKSSEVANF